MIFRIVLLLNILFLSFSAQETIRVRLLNNFLLAKTEIAFDDELPANRRSGCET
jgi:hypothetical protein